MEKVYLRIYAKHDLDLLLLQRRGISMAVFAQNVLLAYAYGVDIHYIPPDAEVKNYADNESFRVSFTVKDAKAVAVLKSIKKKKRNVFVKALMRNALVRQNLCAYFQTNTYLKRENDALMAYDGIYERLIPHKRTRITLDELLNPKKPAMPLPFSETREKESVPSVEKPAEEVKTPEPTPKVTPEPTPKVQDVQPEMPETKAVQKPVMETVASDDAQADLLNMFGSLAEDL